MIKKLLSHKSLLLLLLFALVGVWDAGYLTYEHYAHIIPPCTVNAFADCGKVLDSVYAVQFGVPLALLGLIHYCLLTVLIVAITFFNKRILKRFIFLMTAIGILASAYFVYLQLIVIKAICQYCMISAINSLILYFVARKVLWKEYQVLFLWKGQFMYAFFTKPILFLIDPEKVHNVMTSMGEILGKSTFIKTLIAKSLTVKDKRLEQKVAGIIFKSPVGLSAGFDYEAKLTQITPSLGFGFETVGTITNMRYGGNESPMLGRLPKSKSLMVNKGFKNDGAETVIKKLHSYSFSIPIGISIGRTNTAALKTLKQTIDDIVEAFKQFEKSKVNHTYYELNISCPNLVEGITFYSPENLKELLQAITKLKVRKPIFIKMPIERNDKEVKAMLDVITEFPITGVIFGNLQKDRKDPALVQEEVAQFKKGSFSGKPTERRSNELIKLAYKQYGKKLIIIGTGGIFNAQDAYKKIKLGASLVQLITGMIYKGPHLIAQINLGLVELLEKDGYKNVADAVGKGN